MVEPGRPFVATSCGRRPQSSRCAHFEPRNRMNAARHSLAVEPADDLIDPPRQGQRLRFELIFASLWLAFGLFVLPALIFWVGDALLGGYGENAGLSTFYVDFFGDLADASGRAWVLALGPLLLIYLLRAVFIGMKSGAATAEDPNPDLDHDPGDRRGAGRVPSRRPAPKPAAKSTVKKETARRTTSRPVRIEPRMGGD